MCRRPMTWDTSPRDSVEQHATFRSSDTFENGTRQHARPAHWERVHVVGSSHGQSYLPQTCTFGSHGRTRLWVFL